MPPVVSSTGASAAAFAPTETTATPPTVETLLAAADAARVQGRFTEAANLLERVLVEHGNDSHAALTEFSLGRLYLESLSSAPQAASHFSRAIARRLPTGLDEDARARLVEALSRSGNVAAARDAATTYRALYPNGRRSRDIDRWISAPR
jgi:transmembrane sensor